LTPRRIARFWRQRRGSAAAEFALVLPGLMFLILGAVDLSLLTYSAVALHRTTEAAARYASIRTTLGSTTLPSDVSTYAASNYQGLAIGASYACTPVDCSASGCGHTVTGTGSFRLFFGIGGLTVPLSAKACFP
jgi:Flp pilus assembly protein TadG